MSLYRNKHVSTIVTPGSEPNACPHRPPCAACPRFAEHGIASGARDALNALALAHGLPEISMISGRHFGFRHRARLAIRGKLGSPKIGLFEPGTHHIVHIPRCSIQHPLVNRVANVVRRALADARVTLYSDRAHLGVARYLQIVVERSSQTAQVVLVANDSSVATLGPCLDLIQERLGADLHSLWVNFNSEATNAILGPNFHHWCGPPCVIETFGGAAVHYPPGAFGQSNLDAAQLMIDYIRTLTPQHVSVTEFYAGVGAIGLSLLPKIESISMNEIGAGSLGGLKLGVAALDLTQRAKVTVIAGPAGSCCVAASGVGLVIADPPRKGLDPELSEHLRMFPPERLVYVSCGLDSFIRDVALLTSGGAMKLKSLVAFNLVPFTEHVETVACFERVALRNA